MSGGHLVENVDFGKVINLSVFKGQSQTFDGIINVDEGSGLLAGSIDG